MLVTVARFRDPWEAAMFRGRLEAEDIPAFVIHQHHVGMIWSWSRALHGVKVQVLRDDAAEAGKVMARCLSGAYSAELLELFGYLGEPQCPNCGSIACKRRPAAVQGRIRVRRVFADGDSRAAHDLAAKPAAAAARGGWTNRPELINCQF